MKTMSGVDGAFLHLETQETPMHVASLYLFDLPAGRAGDFHADVKRLLTRRLQAAAVLTRTLAPMPLNFANPVWIASGRLDMDYHLQRITLPAPGTSAQLEDLVGRLHSERLDRRRPLWRIAIIDGLQSGQAGYYIQIHHAALDGQAGVLLVQALFDKAPNLRMPAPRRLPRAERPATTELAAAAIRHDVGQLIKLVRRLPATVKTLAGLFEAVPAPLRSRLGKNFTFGAKTPLNVPITGERGFAAFSAPLETLRQLAHAHDAKLNDIVLAVCSGALRSYLARHGGIPRKPLIAAMPISLRDPGDTEFTTRATLSLVNLNTQIVDPVRRLHAIRDSANATKALSQRARGVIPVDFPTIGSPWLLQALAALYGRSKLAALLPPIANVVISNVPGPPEPLYAAGARMTDYWPLSIVEHGVGLNITVMSYAGQLGFGVTTARCAVPDARELTAALREALAELVACGERPVVRRARPARGARP